MRDKRGWVRVSRKKYEQMLNDIDDMDHSHIFERCADCSHLNVKGYFCSHCLITSKRGKP